MIEILQAHLQKHPGIAKVYFNEAGNWQFHPRTSHPIVKTRDEVLAIVPPVKEDVVEKPAKAKTAAAPEKAADAATGEQGKGETKATAPAKAAEGAKPGKKAKTAAAPEKAADAAEQGAGETKGAEGSDETTEESTDKTE